MNLSSDILQTLIKSKNLFIVKKLVKRTFIYPFYLSSYKKSLERKRKRLYRKEIRQRIVNNDLLKDLTEEQLDHWNKRIANVLASTDNEKINCVKNAGTLKGSFLVMHNGLLIEPLSYYGYPVLKMLLDNKGIHEPQEEYVFQQVLKEMPKGAMMIELGAFWSFYSMWFNKEVADAKNYMIEPYDLESGIKNFRLNNLHGNFFQYYVSDRNDVHENGSKVISVDNFVSENNIPFVDILHSDIQGDELLMLKGAINLLSKKNVGYIFISTHSNELHDDCALFLENLKYIKVCSANKQESYSWDGLLVFKNPEYKGIEKLEISLR